MRLPLAPGLLWQALDVLPPTAHGTVAAAMAGDLVAELALHDLLEEAEMIESQFAVGDTPLICTATLYYVGRVVATGFGWVKLADASWVHWTGRLSVLLQTRRFTGHPNRPPRTEPVGDVIVWTQSIVSHYPGPFVLPTEAQ